MTTKVYWLGSDSAELAPTGKAGRREPGGEQHAVEQTAEPDENNRAAALCGTDVVVWENAEFPSSADLPICTVCERLTPEIGSTLA